MDHELIVVDGGSTDGTREWLAKRPDCRVILEKERQGAVRAFSLGFRAAVGQWVTWLNDDSYPLPGAFENAITFLERKDLSDVGMVAFYHTWRSERNVLDEVERDGRRFQLCHVRGYPYANFGLLRRETLKAVGFIDEGYRFFGFDPDLSLKIQFDLGLKVVGCREAMIVHEEHHDNRKISDLPQGGRDNARLFEKWKLPAPGTYPDPRPEYQRLVADRLYPPKREPAAAQDPHQIDAAIELS